MHTLPFFRLRVFAALKRQCKKESKENLTQIANYFLIRTGKHTINNMNDGQMDCINLHECNIS